MRKINAQPIAVSIALWASFSLMPHVTQAADPPATGPGTTVLSQANELSAAANRDLQAEKFEQALAKFRQAEALFRKAAGGDSSELSNCLNDEASCSDHLGQYANSLPLYKAALEMDLRLHKKQDDADVATAIGNVAGCLMNLDRAAEALPLYESALKMQQRLNPDKNNADVNASMADLATCLEHLGKQDLAAGKADTALPEFARAVDLFEKAASTHETLDVGSCLNQEGLCLEQLGRDADALPIYKEALRIEQKLTKDQADPHVAAVMDNLADTLMNLGRFEEALPVREAELKMKKNLAKDQDDADVATVENSIGYCLNFLGRYEDALARFQSVVEMRKRIYKNEDQMDVVASMNNVAKCQDELGRSADALVTYQSALEMTGRIYKNQDNADLATVMNNVAACQASLGKGDQALVLFQDALDMRRRLFKSEDNRDIAASLNDIGTCLISLGRDADALKSIRASYEMLRRINQGNDSDEVAASLDNQAECLDNLGRMAEALPDHQAALDMRRRFYKNADHPEIAKSLINVATCLDQLGRYPEALVAQKAALGMLLRLYKEADHPDIATVMGNAATTLNNLDRFEDALPLYQQALAMRLRLYKNEDHPDVAICRGLVAGCLMSLDRPTEALPEFRAALEIENRIYKGRDHPIIAWQMANVGQCLSATGKKSEAIPILQQAVAMSQRLSDPDLYRYSSRLGDCFLSMGKFAEAGTAFEVSINALERARASLGGDDEDRMKFMDAQQIDCDAFAAMVRVQMQLNHPNAAAEYLDRVRGRSLLDVLERAERQAGKDLLTPLQARAEVSHDDQLLNQIKQASESLARADDQVRQLTARINFARSLDTTDANALIDKLQPQLDEACRQYAVAHRVAFNLAGATTFSQAASVAQMQSLLKPHQHLMMYSITDRDVVLIVIPPVGQAVTGITLTDSDQQTTLTGVAIEQRIVDYQQSMIRHGQTSRGVRLVHGPSTTRPTQNMTRDGYELFKRLMPPAIWDQIKADDLIYVIPDPGMNGLPLETLIVQAPKSAKPAECDYFLDQGPSICYSPSAAALIKLCGQKSAAHPMTFSHQAVLLGDPVLQREVVESPTATRPVEQRGQTRNASLGAYGSLAPLPGTRKEVAGIYSVLTGHPYAQQEDPTVVVLLGEDATGDRLAKAATNTRYLHLATHGLARSGKDAIYSSIVLTQPRLATSQDTGLLTLEDLFDHWGGKLDGTELVVLSACNSQGIDQEKGNAITDEGVFGLPWGFWYAGSHTVVASLWEVQDDSTAKLMQSFYKQLKSPETHSKLNAFTAARKQLRQEYPEPFFWAPFIYLGDPN